MAGFNCSIASTELCELVLVVLHSSFFLSSLLTQKSSFGQFEDAGFEKNAHFCIPYFAPPPFFPPSWPVLA